MHGMKSSVRAANLAALTLLTSLVFLAGCGLSSNPADGTTTTSLSIRGQVHGGAQPVKGSTITLNAASLSGYSNASTVLTVTNSDANGNFGITGTYTCPTGSQVYIAATGGDPGSGVNNPQLALAAGLGTCSGSLSSSLFIDMNEVTTVATAYALSRFSTDLTHIGTSHHNYRGLANAMKTINNLVNIGTGKARTITPGYEDNPVEDENISIVPQVKINTLADILSGCVNSKGGVHGDGSACGILFATVAGPAPTDTFKAILSIAQNPHKNVLAIYNSLPPVVGLPFQPALIAPPNDWTLAVRYIGGGLGGTIANNRAGASDLKIDGSGNVWVTATHNSAIVELDPFGAPLSPSTTSTAKGGYGGAAPLAGLASPQQIVIDLEGNVWTNQPGGKIAALTSTGTAYPGSPFTDESLPEANGIMIDGNDNVFIPVVPNNSVVKLNHDGVVQSGSGYKAGINSAPTGAIAADTGGHILIANGLSVTQLNNDGSLNTVGNPGSALQTPVSRIVLDGSGDWWCAQGASTQEIVKAAGVTTSSSAWKYAPLSVSNPSAIAVDGGDNIWVAMAGGKSSSGSSVPSNLTAVDKWGASLSPATTGFLLNENAPGTLVMPVGVGIDGSGNVWVATANGSTGTAGASTVVEFVGAAEPAVTPTAFAVQTNTLGQRP